uniref:Uncharacterized protein n=1 Tax=Beauveria caledonica TaxID=38006 RepID=A0A192S1Z3_9HYPO|nr:hypothetical protein [Beauveria caledonica]AMD61825.1 hypothetical protein [Beauveria caledonica]
MTIINNTIENSLENIANISSMMNIDELLVFSLNLENTETKVIRLDVPTKIVYINISIENFIESILHNEKNDFWKHNLNSLYILRDGDYLDLHVIFETINNRKVQVVRGSSQKSHVVSPIDSRLSCYMMILYNMNYQKFSENNAFNYMNKKRYLPTF